MKKSILLQQDVANARAKRLLGAARGSAPSLPPDADFDCWWSQNHPFDWWAKERNGEPLPTRDRLRVWEICRQAWAAAQNI